jgi:CO dehydrogenase maturation factor
MADGADDWVIVDSTAGTDAVATSLFHAYDAIVFVVEPTERSIKVLKDFKGLIDGQDKKLIVVANKCMDDHDKSYIQSTIENQEICSFLPHSNLIRRFEQGDDSALEKLTGELSEELERIEQDLSSIKRDPDIYYDKLVSLHNQMAKEWANKYYSASLEFTPPTNFNLSEVIPPININNLTEKAA